jgi:hypothetical protein
MKGIDKLYNAFKKSLREGGLFASDMALLEGDLSR